MTIFELVPGWFGNELQRGKDRAVAFWWYPDWYPEAEVVGKVVVVAACPSAVPTNAARSPQRSKGSRRQFGQVIL